MASARGSLLLVSASAWCALGLGIQAVPRAPPVVMVATTPSVAPAVLIEPQRHTVALVALGCPKNTVDAEVMLGDLQRNGLRVVSEPRDAEVIIVNTCAFVEDAKRESISAIMDAAKLKADRSTPARALYVTGCMAQRYAQELAEELPEVDAIVGFESYAQIPEQVRQPYKHTYRAGLLESP
jgi:ribosomal protein S12 methylthiotransferase